ncbi:MAG: Hpt domain-containing protein [Hahellaceae bacterium]|nr:Hpt domain-containing protein [Hahellaceae bacterium]
MHSVKGNAGMLQLKGIVQFTHALEEIASSLGKNATRPATRSAKSSTGMDRVETCIYATLPGHQLITFTNWNLNPVF